MTKRPISISIISWFFIVMGGISLVTTTIMINNPTTHDVMAKSPIPIPVQYVMIYLGLVVMIVSGIAMLKGKNWARYLYVIWCLIIFVIEIATSPMKAAMIPGLVGFLVIAFFLFNRKASIFFVRREGSEDA